VSRQKAYDGSTQSALIFAGFGIADVAAAAVVYRRALERGVGRICRGENTMRD
jgi:ornithine cyclodeaminase/alanine dehydrogenase-like protein (mu-crystallin family)